MFIAVIAVAFVLLGGGGDSYSVNADFQNASQLVKGNLVQVSGQPIGKVKDIEISDDGQAQVHLSIDKGYAPLRRGTKMIVRASSLSGIANRYIDVQLGPQSGSDIPDGGVIPASDTTTAVDLDQIFNTIGPKQRESLRRLIRGFADTYTGVGDQTNKGWMYLNPALATSSALFRELNYDTPLFERFIVASSKLVTDLADRQQDLAALVVNLADTTGALGDQKAALAEAIQRLPQFLRQANTTFVNLRATLDDLDPLVADSKPVAKKLRPFLNELRPLARDARPTIKELASLIRRNGSGNDLIELTRSTTALDKIATQSAVRNGKSREGALQASSSALATSTPELAFARPYAVDLTGWFDDYSHSGGYDALGGASRVAPNVNAFAITGNLQAPTLVPIPPDLRDEAFGQLATLGQRQRCPGSAEHAQPDGSVPFKPSPDFACDETQVLPGS